MSLQEIYNRVIVVGQTPAGEPVRVSRRTAMLSLANLEPVTSPAFANAGFEVDASGWAPPSGATVTRDTATFDTGVASGLWSPTKAGRALTATMAGTWKKGVTYVVQLSVRPDAAGGMSLSVGTATDSASATRTLTAGTWNQIVVAWTPSGDATSVSVSLTSLASTITATNVDSGKVFISKPTLVDRRGFTRTKQVPIGAALPSDEVLANTIGDTWLTGHKTTPTRGTCTVKRGAIRERLTGRVMELEELGLRVGELVCFTDRVDPDTGGWGRSMRLVGVKLNNATDEATLTFDDSRADFQTLMSRLDLAVSR